MKKWLYIRVPAKWEGKIKSWISNCEVLFMCRDVKWKYNNLELNMDKTVLDTVLINVSRWNDIVMIRMYFKSFNLSQKLKLVNLCMASMCKWFSSYFVFTSRLKWTHWRASSNQHYLSHIVTKPTKWHVRPVWSVFTVHSKKARIFSYHFSANWAKNLIRLGKC